MDGSSKILQGLQVMQKGILMGCEAFLTPAAQ
jgi:hypothetical protein